MKIQTRQTVGMMLLMGLLGLAGAGVAYGACDQGLLTKLLDRGFSNADILRLCGQTTERPGPPPGLSPSGGQLPARDFKHRGDTKFAREDMQGALVDYTNAITLDPTYVAAYNERGRVRWKLQDYQGALADFTQAISLNPTYVVVYYNRGLLHAKLGNRQAALADLQHAAALYQQQGNTADYQETLEHIQELQR
jgi:tetratricopeptide (TPR) repeat protein